MEQNFFESILDKQLRNVRDADAIIDAINGLIGMYPDKFEKTPRFQFGRHYKDDNIIITIKAFFQFDTWSKIYTIEMPGKDGAIVFCSELVGDTRKSGNNQIGSVFIADRSNEKIIAALKKLEKKFSKKK